MEAVVLARLATGLWRIYPSFSLMILGGAAQHVVLRLAGSHYKALWIATSPFLIALQIFAAHEVYRLWCSRWPGKKGYGSVLAAGLALGVAALAGFSLSPAPNYVDWIVEVQRDVGYVVALALIVCVRIFWVQGGWARSLQVHTGVMIGWFALVALSWLPAAINPDWRNHTNEISGWCRAGLLAIWAIWMRVDNSPAPPPIDCGAALAHEQAIARDLRVQPPGPEVFRD
jgi:hypothetical protein